MKMFILLFFFSSYSFSSEFSFFNGGINYWEKKKTEVQPATPKVKSQKFDWKAYKDPENDEFFREGNHMPPKPFLEVARRPTKENIKNWMEYIDKKNQIQRRFLAALRDYQSKSKLTDEAQNYLNDKSNRAQLTPAVNSRVSITTYFLTTCPACKRMFETLKTLQQNGIYIEAVQLDKESPLKRPLPFSTRPADESEIKAMKSSGLGVPYSIIRLDKKAKTLSGYQTVQSVFKTIQNMNQSGGN